MDASLPGTVGFLNLAYLAEIAVVLNLAYRELKFPELHKKLTVAVKSIDEEAINNETNDVKLYPEYKKIISLLGNEDKCKMWEHVCIRGFFYKYFLKTRISLIISDVNILITVGCLIFFTYFSHLSISPNDGSQYADYFNYSRFGLTIITALPLLFIWLSILCDRFLFGVHGDSGTVYELRKEMLNRKNAEIEAGNKKAKDYKVGE